MNEKISQTLAQMAELENDLRTAVHEQESRGFFQIRGKRAESLADGRDEFRPKGKLCH